MENPATWGEAERVVASVLYDNENNFVKRRGNELVGLSVVRRITDALRVAGLITTKMSDPTEGMTEAEMAAYYQSTHDLSGFMSEEEEATEINEGEADLLAKIEEARAHPEQGKPRPQRKIE